VWRYGVGVLTVNYPRSKSSERNLRHRYGLSLEGYTNMLKAQGNRCPICATNLKGFNPKQTHVDHCHRTKIVRAILCMKCNTGLGSFNHDPSLLEKAARYLRRFEGHPQ
jgi:hypothetical protein